MIARLYVAFAAVDSLVQDMIIGQGYHLCRQSILFKNSQA